MNRRAKFDAASFVIGGEIRNRTNKQTNKQTHTHAHTQTQTVNDTSQNHATIRYDTCARPKNDNIRKKIKNRVAHKKRSRQRSVEAVREEEVKLRAFFARFGPSACSPVRLPSLPSQPALLVPARRRLSVLVSHARAAARAVYSGPQVVCVRRLPPVPAAPDRPSLHVNHARGVTSGQSDYRYRYPHPGYRHVWIIKIMLCLECDSKPVRCSI